MRLPAGGYYIIIDGKSVHNARSKEGEVKIMGRFWKRIQRVLFNRLFLLLMGLVVFIGVLIVVFTGGNVRLFYEYFYGEFLLWLVPFFVFAMVVTGIWKDFINGFRLVSSSGKGITRMELQKAANAMKSARRIVVLESVIVVSLSLVDLLYRTFLTLSLLGPSLRLILLSTAYSSIFNLVVIPLGVRLENMAISFMEGGDEEQEDSGMQDSQTVYFRLRAMGLTDREAEVARLVCGGLSNKEIGQILYISDTTVKKHMTHILEKIGCDSRESLTERVKEQS